MTLAAAGCTTAEIQSWGMWKSDSVKEYLQIRLSTFDHYGRRFRVLIPEDTKSLWEVSEVWADQEVWEEFKNSETGSPTGHHQPRSKVGLP